MTKKRTPLLRFVCIGLAAMMMAACANGAQVDPEKLTPEQIQQYAASLTPEQMESLKSQLTPEQLEQVLAALTPEQRAALEERSAASSESSAASTPAAAKPAAAKQPSGTLRNGDFSQAIDDNQRLPGWSIDFSEWGSGEKRVAYRLTTSTDDGNGTQRLSMGNSLGKTTRLTMSQTVRNVAGGEYIVSLVFQGGPQGEDSGLSLQVNGTSTAFGSWPGWPNWHQVISQPISVQDGEDLHILIEGDMVADAWVDFDDVEMVKKSDFTPKSFPAASASTAATPAISTSGNIANGDFSQPANQSGDPPGWSIQFSEWGSGEKRVAYRLTTDTEDGNGTQRLSMGNSLGKTSRLTMSQTVQNAAAGEYIFSAMFQGGPQGVDSGLSLNVNGQSVPFGMWPGWPNWRQVVTEPITIAAGTDVNIVIEGDMIADAWVDFDNIEMVTKDAFQPKAMKASASAGTAAAVNTSGSVANGDFAKAADASGNPPNWSINFSEWGSGEKRAAYRLTTDNEDGNGTQRLSVGNSLGKSSDLTVEQVLTNVTPGSYIVSVMFQGGPAAEPSGLSLIANGNSTPLGVWPGWRGWKQIASSPVTVGSDGKMTIQVHGTMQNDAWLDLDNVDMVPAGQFTAAAPMVATGPVSNCVKEVPFYVNESGKVSNGNFEDPTEEVWDIKDWAVHFSNWGSGEKKAAAKTTGDLSDGNGTRRLSLGNETGATVSVTIGQEVRNVKPGTYVASITFQGGPKDSETQFGFFAGSAAVPFEKYPGYGKWKQLTTKPFTVGEDGIVKLMVAGRMANEDWMDIDNITLTSPAQHKEVPLNVRRATIAYMTDRELTSAFGQDQVKNGEFDYGFDYTREHLSGWETPRHDWELLTVDLDDHKLGVYNETDHEERYRMQQKISLKPGSYGFVAQIKGPFTGKNHNGFRMRALDENGQVIAAIAQDPISKSKYTTVRTNDFIVTENMRVTLEITMLIPGKTYYALDNVFILPTGKLPEVPRFEYRENTVQNHVVNSDFSEGIDWEAIGYPDGFLPGWDLPKYDWDKFPRKEPFPSGYTSSSYYVKNNVFGVINGNPKDTLTYVLTQRVLLEPGDYSLEGNLVWENGNGATLQLSTAAGGQSFSVTGASKGVQATQKISLSTRTEVTVLVTLTVPPGAEINVSEIKLSPYVTRVNWSAVQVGGVDGTADTTHIQFTFDTPLPELQASNFAAYGLTFAEITEQSADSKTFKVKVDTNSKANGEEAWMNLNMPAAYSSYIFEPQLAGYLGVVVYKAAAAPTPDNLLKNGTFASTGAAWPKPDDWTLSLDGVDIVDWDTWSATLGTGSSVDFEIGFGFWNDAADGVRELSFAQNVTLAAGTYTLSFATAAQGLDFTVSGAASAAASNQTTGSLTFTVAADGDVTITISKTMEAGKYYQIQSASLTKNP